MNVGYDQVKAAKNQLALEDYRANFARRDDLRSRIDERRARSAELNAQIARLQTRLDRRVAALPSDPNDSSASKVGSPPTEDEVALTKEQLDALLKTRRAELASVDAEVDALNTELTGLTVSAPTFEAAAIPNSTDTVAPPTGAATEELLKKLLEKVKDPKLAASTVLDNHINLQYEIIAKQLTLLRDEVGPYERLVFLELPASVYTVPKRANDYMARVEWDVTGYYTGGETLGSVLDLADLRDPAAFVARLKLHETSFSEALFNLGLSEKTRALLDAYKPDTVPDAELLELVTREVGSALANPRLNLSAGLPFAPSRRLYGERLVSLNRAILDDEFEDSIALEAPSLATLRVERAELRKAALFAIADDSFGASDRGSNAVQSQKRPLSIPDIVDRGVRHPVEKAPKDKPNKPVPVRVVDLIPRQSALNVNAVHATVSRINLGGLFTLLTGIGAKVDYQRQKELYEQFINQEIFASAFGKGEKTFSWTFGPLPGTKRIEPGLRTTYAVLVVPSDANAIELTAKPSAFKRCESPFNNKDDVHEGTGATFTLIVPKEETNKFWVDAIDYVGVRSGERATVVITGSNFSPQLGVLVNGYPLTRALSITDPGRWTAKPNCQSEAAAAASPSAAAGAPPGSYEIVGSDKIILSISMGPTYEGTPIISFVSPGKTAALNFFKMRVNLRSGRSLAGESRVNPLFTRALRLAGLSNQSVASAGAPMTAILEGEGFRPGARIFVNGTRVSAATLISTRKYRIEFPYDAADPPRTFAVEYRHNTFQGFEDQTSLPISNTKFVPANSISIKSFVPAFGDTPARLSLLIAAKNLNAAKASVAAIGATVEETFQVGLDVGVVLRLAGERPDPLLVRITDGTVTQQFAVTVPEAPTIVSIKNAATGGPVGAAGGGEIVTLVGENLHRVTRVTFGNTQVPLLGPPSRKVLRVRTLANAAGTVQVYLETDVAYFGVPVTNVADFEVAGKAEYTFKP